MDDTDRRPKCFLALGKAQVDAMFQRQTQGLAIDDAKFIPMVEAVLTAFEKAGMDDVSMEELWEYAYTAYDRACHETAPIFPSEENRRLMQSYLRVPRKAGLNQKKPR